MFAHFLLNIALQSSINPHTFNNYLVLGYGVMGVIGLVYIVSLAVRQRNLRQDIQLMERLLQDEEE
ncbi:MAG: hypothetical protein H6656_09500 [Ardenticatenaceae bacterium]|nr:hypothetical protein [Anaerolineales bacterium]MCB9007580.1 hypothetical protein [Ardenticatenaceae bacterium]